ncbi:altronate dehydratase [Tropicibacter sp. R15_0]|uniref:UxaA family hydrolase n=1 Tax=Tropicibacter sp. R15_0 TaxID=2821101 RepID=UPI001ADB4BD7|nr:altronate dehydratase family protein [Tropicibacter sp. R15_0]MBO9464076.1 altronate dehydratase [Tropicibacter sp. R15_0]
MTTQTLILQTGDSVAIALSDLKAGGMIDDLGLAPNSDIPRGHKIALAPHGVGDNLRRYGQVIGQATAPIAPGDHVHSHNLGMADHVAKTDGQQAVKPLAPIQSDRHFLGYHRSDGKVGTRNYIGVLTSVNCSGSVARFIAQAATETGLLDDFPNVDGIVPIVHGTGCGMSAADEGYATLFRTLAGYAQNPNFGGILLVGLGCEVMQVADLVGSRPIRSDGALRYMTIQSEGGTAATVARGLQELRGIAEIANQAQRAPAPLSALTIGMQCGGSDGYSGITANPALGIASDLIVRHGGTTILSETPEIYGAEHLLTARAETPDVADKLLTRIAWWEDYCARNGGEMDNNPSPGNKRGGLTTILEKSLGAVAKSGSAPLRAVYEFGELIDTNGFVFMDSPGFDPCSVTGQIASGANLIVFTTGRGSVSGYQPVPCVKLATNSEMYRRMQGDMDLNCGDIVSDGVSLEDKGQELLDIMINTASGAQTQSEKLGYGGVEFVPWTIGAVM